MKRNKPSIAAVAIVALVSSAKAQTPPGNGASGGNPAAAAAAAHGGREHQSNAGPNSPPPDLDSILHRSGGSLLQASLASQNDPGQSKLSDVSFYAVPEPEPRTLRKHDLITIVVREESEFKSEGTTDLKKQADLDAKVDAFVRFSLANFALKSNTGGTTPEVNLSGNRNFKGEATVDRTDSLTARITAEVVDVKPNGTLVLQARKRIKTDEEVQQFVLTGIVRAEDVSGDNTVLSTQMYDLELDKSHKGAVRDTTRRGWVPKLLDAINPF